MSDRAVEIVPCPPSLVNAALALVLRELTPAQRRDVVGPLTGGKVEGLLAALVDGEVIGAAWGQRQPGSTAILWPPQWTRPVDVATACRLACAAGAALDEAGIRMTQLLVTDRHAPLVPTFEQAGFGRLADLLYLSWEAAPISKATPNELAFEPYQATERRRLSALVEATYERTQDCAAMNGQRPMAEVLDGYQATGVFSPENWLFVRSDDADVGVLLLADHHAARHFELMYMGVVPSVRGRGYGRQIVRAAQRHARLAGAERIVLAVDAENFPAIKMYNETGFTAWDQRTVLVRFAAADSQTQESP
jgi:ribosomal protein S18 acetylase RimI-like enzyme